MLTAKSRHNALMQQSCKLLDECNEVFKQSKEIRLASQNILNQGYTLRYVYKAYATNSYVKTCSCGRTYLPSEWLKLPFVGYQIMDEMRGELRNCPCKSTLLIITKR